ncbi:MAG: hypothetical protein R3D05_13915 [Dongiaceae bacterium]
MSTGNVTSWDGNILDIGPIYPFVGWEGLMVILCVIFWVGWHILQIKMETKQLEDEAKMLRSGGMQKALQSEHSIERM